MQVAATPLRFISRKSVSRPLENRMNTTPICEKLFNTFISASFGAISPGKEVCTNSAGPIISPARIMPTTCGKPIFRVTIPQSLVENRIRPQYSRMFIT